jgi:hypothetical protein
MVENAARAAVFSLRYKRSYVLSTRNGARVDAVSPSNRVQVVVSEGVLTRA